MSSTAGTMRISAVSRTDRARQFAGAMGGALLVLFVGVTCWLLVRRLSGALAQPPNELGIIAAAVAIEFAAFVVRRTSCSTQYSVLSTQYGNVSITLVAAVALLSLSFSATPAWGLLLAWFVLLGSELAIWQSQARSPIHPYIPLRQPNTSAGEPEESVRESEVPAGLVQQLTRVRELDRESIHVLATADIAAQDRLGVVHISFCPPLESRPELTAHAVEADDIEVRLTQAESFGARVEVRAKQVQSEPRGVVVEVIGSVPAPKSA